MTETEIFVFAIISRSGPGAHPASCRVGPREFFPCG